MNRKTLEERGARHLIPAYSRIDLVPVAGEGARIIDADGTRYLDLYGGHAVSILGHSPAPVIEAIKKQAEELLFYSNLVHLPSQVRAAERLSLLAPWEGGRVFFTNSGTESNETALKMARQATGRDRLVAFQGGFHGRTLGSLAVCGMGNYRRPAEAFVDPADLVRFLDLGDDLAPIDDTCAAVLVEPIQSMGGMRVLPEELARALRARCDATGALLVFDEIQTAPARTGHWFAGERWGVVPDMITMAKGIGAGFPVGAVLARPEVAATVGPGDQGTTFGGGPLASAAVDATLAELERIDAPGRARWIEERFRQGLPDAEILGHGGLLGIRVTGPEVVRQLREEHHVLSGGCPGDSTVLRLFPPLSLEDEELEEGLEALRSVL